MYYTANLFIAFTQNFHYIIIIIILDILRKKTYMHFIIFVRANEVCIRSLEV